MPFDTTWTLSEISLFSAIDGEGCDEESAMGKAGLIIWFIIVLYFMVGQFVLCEEFFVPALSALGNRWKLREDVQGATLLAVGSSSPELFTALLGILFYPNDNPGPGTNVGSAVFNMCIIIGLSAMSAPRVAKLRIIPFLRDSISYFVSLVMLFIFYDVTTPHSMDLWESILLTVWWIVYVIMVFKTDFLATRCCCCIQAEEIAEEIKLHKFQEPWHKWSLSISADVTADYIPLSNEQLGGPSTIALTTAHDLSSQALKLRSHKKRSVVVDGYEEKSHVFGVEYDRRGDPIQNPTHNLQNIHVPANSPNIDLQLILNNLNRHQRQNVNKGWIVVVVPSDDSGDIKHNDMTVIPISVQPNESEVMNSSLINSSSEMYKGRRSIGDHVYVRRRTLIEAIEEQRIAQQSVEHLRRLQQLKREELRAKESISGEDDDGDPSGSRMKRVLHTAILPWVKLFHFALPKPDGSFFQKHLLFTISMIIIWLGILTFIVLDSSEKIGECLDVPGDLLGITLLAVGSSLPDCISSVLVARQMKIDMAVSNAFGSNVFDINLCIGLSFLLGSLMNGGESISLGNDNVFAELIVVAAILLVILWVQMWCSMFRFSRWIGVFLIIFYAIYLVLFSVIFMHAADLGVSFGES